MAETSDPVTPPVSRERSPEEILGDIRDTREEMSAILDQIEDRVSPTRIRDRQTARIRSGWRQVRDTVMGAAEETGSRTQSRWRQVRDTVMGAAEETGFRISEAETKAREQVREGATKTAEIVRSAPETAVASTRGNPLAAGLVAFGIGALVGSLVPATRREQQAADELRDRFEEPVKQQALNAVREGRDRLQEPARQAVDTVKETTVDAVQTVRDQARESARSVQAEAQTAQERTRDA